MPITLTAYLGRACSLSDFLEQELPIRFRYLPIPAVEFV